MKLPKCPGLEPLKVTHQAAFVGFWEDNVAVTSVADGRSGGTTAHPPEVQSR